MVLVLHELFNLLLTALKLLLDLLIPLFDGIVEITLSRTIVFKGFLSILLGLFPLVEFLLVVVSHGGCSLI